MSLETSEPTAGQRQAVERFEAVTDTALAHLSLDELLHDLLIRVQRILAADTAASLLLDGDVLVERSATGLEEADTRDVRIPVGAGFVGRVAAEKRPVVIEQVDHTQLVHPVLRESGIRSLLGVPILFEGRVIGVLHVGTLHPRHFRRDDAQLLQVVADRIGLGIEYSRLYQEECAARARSEVEQRRTRFLVNVSALLATTLDYEATLRNLARLAVPELGDWCVIDMLGEQGQMRRVAVAHVMPAKEPLAWELERRHAMHPDDAYSPAQVARTGRAELIPEVTEALLAKAARDPDHLDLFRQLGLASHICVPLVARGRTLGTLSVATSGAGRRYTREDLAFTEEVAARAALAVDNVRLYREAQETSRLKDEFLATLSHELRTPLTSVLAWMWMLRRGRLDAPAVERARDTMEKSIRSLLHIIDDLLDVSRAIRGQLRLDVRPIGLVPVIQAAVDAVRPAASARDIRLRTTIDSDAGLVQGDPSRLQQVVWNLLTNAIKFTPAGGRVHVHLERADRAGETGAGRRALLGARRRTRADRRRRGRHARGPERTAVERRRRGAHERLGRRRPRRPHALAAGRPPRRHRHAGRGRLCVAVQAAGPHAETGGRDPRAGPHGLRPPAGPGARARGRLPGLRRQALRASRPGGGDRQARAHPAPEPASRPRPVRGHHHAGRRRPGNARVQLRGAEGLRLPRAGGAGRGRGAPGLGEASRRDRSGRDRPDDAADQRGGRLPHAARAALQRARHRRVRLPAGGGDARRPAGWRGRVPREARRAGAARGLGAPRARARGVRGLSARGPAPPCEPASRASSW